ncbi:histidine kinase [Fulvivirga imtechensis AK7]|uniref:Histidine kinase n=1 Tax=Fulvivirga imtechensis AK7 TaxID=1237149 RepID=L8JIR4_9BACT|nr:DNA-binding response regulator [Fulvivirga imtechensis]ELR68710.1 histidine kinase [Fulvivirga imtechensis AK7]
MNDSKNDYTILIVEDNPELLNYIEENLNEKYHCLTADCGEKGLQIARDTIPDIIITDWVMPGMSGVELVECLKREMDTDHIPIVMLTAKDDIRHKLNGLGKGADEYITKPFDIEELVLRCSNILKTRDALRRKVVAELMLKPANLQVEDKEQAFLLQVKGIIEENISDPTFSVVKLQDLMGMSRMVLHRKLRTLIGFSAINLIKAMKMERAREILERSKDIGVAEVAYDLGYSDPSYFSKCYKQYFGSSPSSYEMRDES